MGAFLFIVCFAGYISYAGELDSKRRELQEVASNLESSKKGFDSRETLLNTAKEQLSTLQENADKFNTLTKDKQLLGNKITELEESRKKLLKDFLDLVQKVRLGSEGMELATVTLNSGQVLQGVKLQKITDTSVSLSHSNGLIKVEGKDLPDDLRKRFRYGMEPTVAVPIESQSVTGGSQSAPTAASPPKSGTPASHYQIEIDALDQKITQLEKSKTEWSNLADSYRSQASTAQAYGRPSYTFRAQAAQADQNVQTVNTQISKLQEEQVGLRKKMANAMAIP
ncbi:MAG: hypothetical protein RL693_2897 [Verrucomicrobiota bacterium]